MGGGSRNSQKRQPQVFNPSPYMNLNSRKAGDIGDYIGDHCRDYKGDSRSLDDSSNVIVASILLSFPSTVFSLKYQQEY